MDAQLESMRSRSGHNHSLPYMWELPDVCLMWASLEGVIIRIGFQPGSCQYWKGMSYTFPQWWRNQPFSPDWKQGPYGIYFWRMSLRYPSKLPYDFPISFFMWQLLILSSGIFEGKGFLSEACVYWIPLYVTKLSA